MHNGGLEGPKGLTRQSSQNECAQSPHSASARTIPCRTQLPMPPKGSPVPAIEVVIDARGLRS